MPFTPFHMGAGVLIKSLLRGNFSLMVFGWTQVLMDIQPLIGIVTGQATLHGVTHTYVGACLIAFIAAATGKPIMQAFLTRLRFHSDGISWRVACVSALIGSVSHVFLDALMHHDMQPFAPMSSDNPMLGVVSVAFVYKMCVYSGVVGLLCMRVFHGLSAVE